MQKTCCKSALVGSIGRGSSIHGENGNNMNDSFEEGVKDICKYGSTERIALGCTYNNMYCIIVLSAHKCQVSTRGSWKFSDSDHAALVINMTCLTSDMFN